MKNINPHSSTYIGTIPANDEHIRPIIRSALKGTGFSLRQCGRNPNRKQFYNLYEHKARLQFPSVKGEIRYDLPRIASQRGGIQQDLPIEHATSVALYLKASRNGLYDTIIDVKKKVAKALAGQPVKVTNNGSMVLLGKVKNVDTLHEIVTCIGQACKILASA
jgi:hypothetical protein